MAKICGPDIAWCLGAQGRERGTYTHCTLAKPVKPVKPVKSLTLPSLLQQK